MKKLIYFTGEIDSPFFINEIGLLRESFDSVFVVAYKGNKTNCDAIAREFGFCYTFANKNRISIFDLISWRKSEHVKAELNHVKSTQLNKYKKILYIYLYGIFVSRIKRALIKEMQCNDDIYLYSFWLSRPAYGVSYYRSLENVKRAVSRTHRYDLYEEENNLGYLPFRKYIAKRVDTIYFSSKDTIDYYKGKNYSEGEKCPSYKLSYLGTRMPCWKKTKLNTIIVIASCSYIIPRKRLDLIIEFMYCLIRGGSKIRWIHIGDGQDEEKIKKMAFEKLEEGTYQFLGKMEDDQIYDTYMRENVDFFINMSDSEGIPVSIMEALSEGIPVIARNVGGISDAVINGYNGVLLERTDLDLEELASSIKAIHSNEAVYSNLSKNAFEHWNKTFCRDNNIIKVGEDIISDDVIEPV